MTSAHAKQEADQLGNLIGSVQHELNPLHRQAIEARAQTLKYLVRNVPSVTEHIDRGLAIQQSFREIGDHARVDDSVFSRLVRERGRTGAEAPPLRHAVGSPAFSVGDSDSAIPSSVRSGRSSHARARVGSAR